MKKLYILLLFACFYQAADAQVYIEREVVSSGGDNFISGQIILTSTIGEIATETLGNMQFHMTQGFQQSEGLVVPSSRYVSYEGGITSFMVLAPDSVNWVATCAEDWCEITYSGTGIGTITATYTSNELFVPRIANILVEVESIGTVIVTVHQAIFPIIIEGYPNVQSVSADAGFTTFSITSNTSWRVVENIDWININPMAGDSIQELTVAYDTNYSAYERTGEFIIIADSLDYFIVLSVVQEGATPYLTINPDTINVGSGSGNTAFSIESNVNWMIDANEVWFDVNPESGSNMQVITIDYNENISITPRSGIVPIYSDIEDIGDTFVINQDGAFVYIIANPEFAQVNADPGTISVTVTSNTEWIVNEHSDWLSIDPLSANGDKTLIITYESNQYTVTRSGKIILETLGGTVTTSITIIQSGAEPTLVVTPSEQQVGHQQGSIGFSVSSNTCWTVATNANWLEIDPFEGYLDRDFTVFYDENLLASPRSATITLTTTDDIIEFEVILYQLGAPPTISVSPSFQEVGFEAGTCILTVSSNTHWTASTNVPWLTFAPVAGELDGVITVSFAENPFALSRQGVINFMTSDGIAEASVIIEQVAAPAFLSVIPSEHFVDPEAGTIYFSITSNALWEISNSETWLHVIPESGIGNATITLNYDANSSTVRQGLIYVNVSGLPSEVVTINQGTPFILILEPDSLTVGPSSGMAYLSVISNTNWTAESNVPWLQVSPVNGSDNDTITLIFNANITDSVRIAEISVFSAGLPVRESYLLQLPGQGTERVILPELIAGTNAIIEIPVMVSDLTGYGIITNEFIFSYDASVLIPSPPYVITTGTMLGNAGWTLIIDQPEADKLSVSALGSEPLSGSGVLAKLKFKVVGEQGTSSDLSFDEFVFNGNNPLVEITNGFLNVPIRNCGDADENGVVQAYDASLVLKHSIGLITLPPVGAYNADVNEDNLVRAFDAALILRAAINLPIPPGVSTCFNYDNITIGTLEYDFQFNAVLRNYEELHDFINAEILFTGITRPEKIFSISFDVTNPVSHLNSVEFIDLPPGYSVFTNKISERIIRIAIIHPMGILSQDLNLRVLIGHCGIVSLALKDIVINDHEFPDILISNPFSSSLCRGGAMLTAYPNPFRASTTIAYEVIENGNIEIEIIDLFGRSVDVLYRGMQDEGFYNLTWYGKSKENMRLPQGWYIVRMKTENYIQQVRISLIR